MSIRLNLKAEDAEDLQVIAAALQDAVMRAGDTRFNAKTRIFTAVFNRYRWEDKASKAQGARSRAGLSVAGVLKVQAQNIKRTPKDAVAQLLTIRFEPSQVAEDPGGAVILEFAGGGRLKLDVECLDLLLSDVSDSWRARARPNHEGGEA
ncbi:MAG: DUF2948 family protein [Caulobacterales bacterium]